MSVGSRQNGYHYDGETPMKLKRTQILRSILCAAAMCALWAGLSGCPQRTVSDENTPAVTVKEPPVAKTQQPKPRSATAREPAYPPAKPIVIMETSKGTIRIELLPDKAPLTVANFLRYVDEKFYDGTIFHRVIPDFVIQGGGFTVDLKRKPTRAAIKNEASPDVKNLRGTLSMARTGEVHSATSQFFINVVNNPTLDQRNKTARGYGYAVFARVIEGMDVVDAIGMVPTTTIGSYHDVPTEPVVIKSARRAE